MEYLDDKMKFCAENGKQWIWKKTDFTCMHWWCPVTAVTAWK